MRTKLRSINMEILANDFDVIVLTETWLNTCVFDGEIFDTRYNMFRRDRQANTFSEKVDGGGVLIAVTKKINCYRNYDFESKCEDLLVTLELKSGSNLNLCAVYLPSPLEISHLEHFLDSSRKVLDNMQDVMIIGDFNIAGIDWVHVGDGPLRPTNYRQKVECVIVDFMSSCNLNQYNHVLNHQNRILDFVLTNIEHNVIVSKSNSISCKVDGYHPPIEINIHKVKQKMLQVKHSPKHQYFRGDYNKIRSRLDAVHWDAEFKDSKNVDEAVAKFYDIVGKVINELVPLKKYKNKNYPVWYSKNLISILREKEKCRQKFKIFKNQLDELEWKLLKDRSKNLIKECYSKYIERNKRSKILLDLY
ncbi:hypothetical protein ABMA27_003451 [Loxostege sticticalis]|uniref:Endonuclease/exonuclease/phosphatase domain-containing protein n=1 Tax=Loxostege sticticalis TaxID=481309 RepID=A0ABR3HTA9_LOXSC